jgi:prepilin-type N-terminal cleavage/methylation domain-containing protein
MSRRPSPGALRSSGFTLVELLVTLVILAMISGLLWQAMQQIGRIERVMQSAGVESQRQVVRREWLRSLLESALAGQLNTVPQFSGDSNGMRLASAETPDIPGVGAGLVQLRLKRDERVQRNELLIGPALPDTAAAERAWTTLLTWTGPLAGFKFMDEKGSWLEAWPRPGVVIPGLPVAVLIEIGDEAGGPLIAGIVVNESARRRRLDWEQR